ncbi:hypothetical protein CD943_16370 [Brevundimonas diminuta]|uniref:Uncharacterized protein n=1 Tax=Brevundimonas diminuta TaxID=293 RepID=A0A1Z3M1U7_BREDI|nr:hypothetical protein CD943_16370 [Brevundimonas diminuta]
MKTQGHVKIFIEIRSCGQCGVDLFGDDQQQCLYCVLKRSEAGCIPSIEINSRMVMGLVHQQAGKP